MQSRTIQLYAAIDLTLNYHKASLTDWEYSFLTSIANKRTRILSVKQKSAAYKIVVRFGYLIPKGDQNMFRRW